MPDINIEYLEEILSDFEDANNEPNIEDASTDIAQALLKWATRFVSPKDVLLMLDAEVKNINETIEQLWENADEIRAEVRSGFRHSDAYEIVHEKSRRASQLEDIAGDYLHERSPHWDTAVEKHIADGFNLRDILTRVAHGVDMLEATKHDDIAALKLLLIPAGKSAIVSVGDAVWAKRDLWYDTPEDENGKCRYTCIFYEEKGFITRCGSTNDKHWYDVEFVDSEGNKIVLEKLTSEFDFTITEPPKRNDVPF